MAAIETCFQVSQVPLTEAVHNLSIEDILPESPRKRIRAAVSDSSSTSSNSLVDAAQSAIDTDSETPLDENIDIDETVSEIEFPVLQPVMFSSRRLTNQQRERMETVHISISKENYDDPNLRPKYFVDFEGYGAIDTNVFQLQQVR
jgi:hypothetical protein